MKFEIGVVYENSVGRLWLAVSHDTLLSCRDGKETTYKPRGKYPSCRSFPVEDLCERWNISIERLDELSAKYLAPPPPRRSRPRGSRRSKAAEEQEGRELRFARILVGSRV